MMDHDQRGAAGFGAAASIVRASGTLARALPPVAISLSVRTPGAASAAAKRKSASAWSGLRTTSLKSRPSVSPSQRTLTVPA